MRRVITGLDDEGRSSVIVDETLDIPANTGVVVWKTHEYPADNNGAVDTGGAMFDFGMMKTGTTALLSCFAPGSEFPMHATNSIDYVVVISGELISILERGEVTLRAGDLMVMRGVSHGWRNETDEPAYLAVVNSPALPVGEGATV